MRELISAASMSCAGAWCPTGPREVRANLPPLKSLLAPYPSEDMVSWPVGTRVGNVKNNDPTLIEPIAAD